MWHLNDFTIIMNRIISKENIYTIKWGKAFVGGESKTKLMVSPTNSKYPLCQPIN